MKRYAEYSNLQGLSRNVLLAVLVPYTIFFIPIKMLSIFIMPLFRIVCWLRFNMFIRRKVTDFTDEFLYFSNDEPRPRSIYRRLFDIFSKARMDFLRNGWQIAYMHQNGYKEGHVIRIELTGNYEKNCDMIRWCYTEFETLDQFCFYEDTSLLRQVNQGGGMAGNVVVFMIRDHEPAIRFKLLFCDS